MAAAGPSSGTEGQDLEEEQIIIKILIIIVILELL